MAVRAFVMIGVPMAAGLTFNLDGSFHYAGRSLSKAEAYAAIAAMQTAPTIPTVQARACDAVSAFASSLTEKGWLLDIGAVDAGIRAMRNFPTDMAVQRACSHALGMMSLFDFRVQTAAGEKGAVELVVNAMKAWPMEPSMQMGGDSGCFMDFSEANRQRWQDAGGIELNLQSIRNHYGSPQTVVQAWYAFSSGTQTPNAPRFVQGGGIELAKKCMEDFGPDNRIREETMQATRNVGTHSAEFRNLLADIGMIPLYVTALHEAPYDMHQASPGCANIAILATHNATHRATAVEANATAEAFRAIKNFESMSSPIDWAYDAQYTVYEDCMDALVALARHPLARQYLVEAGALTYIRTLRGNNPENGRLRQAIDTLSNELDNP